MEATEDRIVDISESREKFFGCSGKMLLPCPATVAALLHEIPQNTLLTTAQIQKELAKRHNVQVTCPVAARKALQTIAQDSRQSAAYWRVVKKNGELLSIFPGGLQGHAALLTQEGHSIETGGKGPKVSHFRERLIRFEQPI